MVLKELDEIFGTNIVKKPEEKSQQPQQAKPTSTVSSVLDMDDDDIFGSPVGHPALQIRSFILLFFSSLFFFLFLLFFSFSLQIPAFVPKKKDPEPLQQAAPVTRKEPEPKKESMFSSFQVCFSSSHQTT